MSERETQNAILLLARGAVRLFRQNVGQGWVGRLVSKFGGRVVLDDARPLRAGLCEGSSDLIGWRSVVITPEMVGRRVAIFTAIEVKSRRGSASGKQSNFLDVVRGAGGLAGVARTVAEAEALLFDGLPDDPRQ